MIDEGQAFAYFDAVHGPLQPSTNGWYSGVCPLCADLKLAVNFEYNIVKCWKMCFDKQHIINFIQDIEGVRRFEAYEILEAYDSRPLDYTFTGSGKVEVSKMSLPVGYQSILRGKGVLGDRARDMMTDRGFDLDYLDSIGVGYCNEEDEDKDMNFFGYIIIPFKKSGRLVYYIGRDFIGNYPRYKNPPKERFGVGKSELLFNEEALHMQDKIYLVEGWSDAATMGKEGVAHLGTDVSTYQISAIINSPVKKIVIVPDIGAYNEGLHTALKLYRFKEIKVLDLRTISKYGGKDVNDFGKKDVLKLEDNTDYSHWGMLYTELRKNA